MKPYRLRAVRDWQETCYLVVTPSAAAKSMFFYVQEIGRLQALSDFCTEREGLTSFLIIYTHAGKGYLKYEGKEYVLEPRQAFFIDCMNYQYYETDRLELWEFSWIHFFGATSRGYYEQFMKNNNGPVAAFQDDGLIPGHIQRLIELHSQRDVRTEILSSRILVELLTEFLLNGLQDRELTPNFLPDYIHKVLEHMERRFDGKITLDQLAGNFGVSKYHLAREFKKYVGHTPNEYLTHIRLNSAKDMLKNSGMSVVEIAEQTGFGNVSHFIETFRKHEDITPLTYRKLWR